ncbi:MAG: hypothetical protein ABIP75_17180, partial [Pyrinomonadaceae bacterium]
TGSAGVLAGEARRANVNIDSIRKVRAALVTLASAKAAVIHGLRFRALRSSPAGTPALPVLEARREGLGLFWATEVA